MYLFYYSWYLFLKNNLLCKKYFGIKDNINLTWLSLLVLPTSYLKMNCSLSNKDGNLITTFPRGLDMVLELLTKTRPNLHITSMIIVRHLKYLTVQQTLLFNHHKL